MANELDFGGRFPSVPLALVGRTDPEETLFLAKILVQRAKKS